MKFKFIFVFFLAVLFFPLVYSEAITPSCCELKKTGEKCMNIENSDECASKTGLFLGVLCGSALSCRTGCCYNELEGIYDRGVAKRDCRASFAENDPNCVTLNKAATGCCIVGTESYYINRRQCELKTPRGSELNWSEDISEASCIAMQYSQNEGACVLYDDRGNKICRIATRQGCFDLGGSESNFFGGYLCTAKEINASCEKTSETKCFEGKDEVYFIDSCGNKANIYDTRRKDDNSYWEKIVLLNDSCGYMDKNGNANSASCGNCNRFLGGICASKDDAKKKASYGNYICKDTNCMYKGKSYENGESWCEYDSAIENGNDAVGSRHWRYTCNYGNVDILGCADYRNEVCVQKDNFASANPPAKFSRAECMPNNALGCLQLNNNAGNMAECAKLSECTIKTINFSKFNLNFCLPRTPLGFNSHSEEDINSFSPICAIGSKPCIIEESCTYDCRGNLKECVCVGNCECLTQEFTDKMNDVCKSIGDCGLEFNIAGKYTKNFQVVNTTENISASALEKLRSLINPIQGKFLSPQDLTYFMLLASSLKSNTGTNMPEETGPGLSISGRSDKDKSKETSKYVDWVAPLGVAALVTGFSSTYDSMYDNTNRYYDSEYGRDARHTGSLWDSFDNHGQWGEDATAKAKTGGNKYAYNLFDGFGKTAIGAYGGWYGGGYLSKVSGFKEGSTSDYMMKAGASLFLGSIFNDGTDAFTKGLWGASGNFENEREWGYSDSLDGDPNYGSQGDAQGNFWTSTPMLGLYAMALSYVFDEDEDDGEECRTQTITTHRAVFFECKPWSPPVGGADCEKCNNDETRPCSEYRCSSLGAGCEIVNKGTNNEICVNNASNDITPPEIKETMDLDKRIRYSRRGKDIEISGRSGGCLDAFNPYLIGIKTNEPAECKYSFKPKEKFEELEYSLGSGYVYNHISQIRMPNPSLVQNWDGKIAMYVKCRDVQGNPSPPGYEFFKIAMCVNSANDLIPPVILTIPSNGTYVRKNATQIGIRVYTNEPAECRWSAEDKQYDLMENNISCLNQPAEITLLGYLCGAVMNTNANKNTIYIRCKDQPQFAGKNESKRMANFQSKELTLLKAESPLDILSIAPNSDFETTTLVNLVALKALTSGGAGDVLCSYSFTGYENMILFKDNNGDEHEQVFDGGLTPGNYKIYIKCEDITGDFAVREARFNIIYDANPTEIARIFTESDALKLLTLKDRECKYSTDNEVKCSFNFNLGRAIGIGKTHTIEFEKGKINYVKCANKFGEVPEGCTIIVKVI